MRWHSTPESVKAGEPSVLAVAETVGAIALSIYIGWRFGSWWHLAIGASIAPFLLLRTDESCMMALSWFERYRRLGLDLADSGSGPRGKIIWGVVGTTVLLLTGMVAVPMRALATIIATFRRPLQALQAIPGNWTRVILLADSCVSPEWLPPPENESAYIESHNSSSVNLDFFRVYSNYASLAAEMRTGSWGTRVALLTSLGLLLITFSISAFAYRWSLKSTAIVWLPILWALKPARHGEPAGTYIRLFLRSDLVRLVVAVSFGEIVLFVAKYLAFVNEHKLAITVDAWKPILGDRLAAFFAAFARPGEFPLWQIAATINAALMIVVFFMARSFRNKVDENIPVDAETIDRKMGRILQVRRLFTSYAIACNLYAAYHLAKDLPVPPIGSKVFPWL